MMKRLAMIALLALTACAPPPPPPVTPTYKSGDIVETALTHDKGQVTMSACTNKGCVYTVRLASTMKTHLMQEFEIHASTLPQ